jgi:hypothetical protein
MDHQGGWKSRRRVVAIVAALLVILIGAAFVGGQLLGRKDPGGTLPGGPQFIGRTRAPELPATPADAVGIFSERIDTRVLVTTHITKYERKRECDTCPVQHNIAADGPVVEVVITHDTQLYRNTTDFNSAPVNGKIQETVAPGVIDEIDENALIEAWGTREGDRLVALTLLYSYLPQ